MLSFDSVTDTVYAERNHYFLNKKKKAKTSHQIRTVNLAFCALNIYLHYDFQSVENDEVGLSCQIAVY